MRREVERPSCEQLLFEIEESSYVAVGRKYGVSDNAIRKWLAQYEREFELFEPASVAGEKGRRAARPAYGA